MHTLHKMCAMCAQESQNSTCPLTPKFGGGGGAPLFSFSFSFLFNIKDKRQRDEMHAPGWAPPPPRPPLPQLPAHGDLGRKERVAPDWAVECSLTAGAEADLQTEQRLLDFAQPLQPCVTPPPPPRLPCSARRPAVLVPCWTVRRSPARWGRGPTQSGGGGRGPSRRVPGPGADETHWGSAQPGASCAGFHRRAPCWERGGFFPHPHTSRREALEEVPRPFPKLFGFVLQALPLCEGAALLTAVRRGRSGHCAGRPFRHRPLGRPPPPRQL